MECFYLLLLCWKVKPFSVAKGIYMRECSRWKFAVFFHIKKETTYWNISWLKSLMNNSVICTHGCIMSKFCPISLALIIPSTRLMDNSYDSVLEYEFFASLWKQIWDRSSWSFFSLKWQADDGLPTMRQVVSSAKQKFSVSFLLLNGHFYSAL